MLRVHQSFQNYHSFTSEAPDAVEDDWNHLPGLRRECHTLMGEERQQDKGNQQLQHEQPPEHGRGEVIHTLLYCVLVKVAELGSQLGLS